MPTNPVAATINTWSQLANEQSYNEMTLANLNSNTIPTVYDPIYEKLIMQISDTIYREMRIEQRWANIGATAPMNEYPGILREIYMERRKAMDYAMEDAQAKATQTDILAQAKKQAQTVIETLLAPVTEDGGYTLHIQ